MLENGRSTSRRRAQEVGVAFRAPPEPKRDHERRRKRAAMIGQM